MEKRPERTDDRLGAMQPLMQDALSVPCMSAGGGAERRPEGGIGRVGASFDIGIIKVCFSVCRCV